MDELPHRVELLRRAPTQLPADDLSGPHHARRTGAWSGRDPNPTESIGESAHLLVTRGVGKL